MSHYVPLENSSVQPDYAQLHELSYLQATENQPNNHNTAFTFFGEKSKSMWFPNCDCRNHLESTRLHSYPLSCTGPWRCLQALWSWIWLKSFEVIGVPVNPFHWTNMATSWRQDFLSNKVAYSVTRNTKHKSRQKKRAHIITPTENQESLHWRMSSTMWAGCGSLEADQTVSSLCFYDHHVRFRSCHHVGTCQVEDWGHIGATLSIRLRLRLVLPKTGFEGQGIPQWMRNQIYGFKEQTCEVGHFVN